MDGTRKVEGRAAWTRFLVGFAVLWAVLATASAPDPTARWGLAVLAVVLAASVGVGLRLDGPGVRNTLRAIGLGRPDGRGLAAAVVVSGLVLLMWPVIALATGERLTLRADWPVVLVGVLALHGVAEELVWRGYVFRRLARGRGFWAAVAWSMPLIAVTHVPILLAAGPVIGLGAMLVAAATCLSLSRLFVLGGGTVWAPGLLHAAIDSFKLVAVPVAAQSTAPLVIIGVSLVVPLLALAVPPRRAPLAEGTAR